MKTHKSTFVVGALCTLLAGNSAVWAASSAGDAEKLKTTLTPFGSEKEGNKEGTIPAWSGGYTTPIPGFKNGGKRPDPFASEKPLFSITAKNMDQYSDKLTDGTKALLKKYPSTYRVDVYPTHRTAAAPQWVYDNTYQNASRASMKGDLPTGVYGGIPFPLPKSGVEAMWNHLLRWRGTSWRNDFSGYLLTADGKRVLLVASVNDFQMPYYFQEGSPEKFDGDYWMVRSVNNGPPIRAGEAITAHSNLAGDKTAAWVYLTGQRRVRKAPNPCCDTPTPFSAGVSSYDEVDVFTGADSLERFDWKIIGKKELYIPYNSNKTMAPKLDEVLGQNHLNPDHVRWELHRVWAVEANLKKGMRHTSPKTIYYLDEDTWTAVLADRWDAKGQLWRALFNIMYVAPDVPATTQETWGFYDLVGGTAFINVLFNEKAEQFKLMPRYPDRVFNPDAMAGQGVR